MNGMERSLCTNGMYAPMFIVRLTTKKNKETEEEEKVARDKETGAKIHPFKDLR